MGMLGNSKWGLLPMQKQLLYMTCVLPVAELFAIYIGLLRSVRLENVKTILVFTDSMALAHA
jgi:hypothetical protein